MLLIGSGDHKLSQAQTLEREEAKKEGRLSKEAIELLAEPNFGHVATINRDGTLHVTQVWVDHEGDKYVVFNSAQGRRKVRNLKRDSRVAISIADIKNPYHYMTVSGKVVQITEEGANAHINKLAKKYLGKEEYPWRSPDEKRVIVKIAPIWVHLQ